MVLAAALLVAAILLAVLRPRRSRQTAVDGAGRGDGGVRHRRGGDDAVQVYHGRSFGAESVWGDALQQGEADAGPSGPLNRDRPHPALTRWASAFPLALNPRH